MTTTIARLLAASGLARIEAEALAAHALGRSRASLLAHANHAISDGHAEAARALFARRRAGEPLAYIVGHREFYSLELAVTPDVLIPRPETELLVDLALERLAAPGLAHGARPRVLDLATGSGAVAIAVAKHAPHAAVWASDASPAALAVARANAARHGVAIRFVASDWFAALAGEAFRLIVANPPYVAEGDPHLAEGDLPFEPRAALVSGRDGLDAIRRIVACARAHLAPQGWLAFEHGHDQAARCRALLHESGYRDVTTYRDLAGIERVTAALAP
ncbi:MAG: peptide chain release factor N(5)-glutamine methyltransferase [Burkholderiales bacterium]|nr:peptide chain release factor N(5)-glutamine methyltransferase [Burkholderiales bacterium]